LTVRKCVTFACATFVLGVGSAAGLGSAAVAQGAQGPRPVARADYIKTIDARFNAMDTNHDKSLSKAELVAEQQTELQQAKARVNQQLAAKFKELDTNKDGQLSMQEFLAVAPAIHTSEGPDQMLQRYDTNHDGKISPDEMRAPEIARFNRVDTNHDGIATPAEMKAAAGQR
jgi:hypothetical protein